MGEHCKIGRKKEESERDGDVNRVFLKYLLNATRVDNCAIREHETIDMRFKLVEGEPVSGRMTEG
jgi:hypothetical protein